MTSSRPASPPTEAEHFKACYKLWIGALFLIIGSVTTGVGLWAMLLEGGFIGAAVLGVLLMAVGFLYLSRPYFAIAPNRLTVYNLLGNAVKRYPFESFSHLSIESGAFYIESSYADSPREKINISRWMVRSSDWRRLQSLLKQ